MDIKSYDYCIREEHAEEFEKLYEMLIECNKKFNLTSVTEREEVYTKHFLDSVTGEKYLKNGADVCEIGSGGGFPSLPLKIIRSDLKFTLIESTGKKCGYLKSVAESFNFSDVRVLNIRAEEGARDGMLRERFDAAVARAVARLNTLCEYCLPFVKTGGVFIAYKGECGAELEEAKNAIEVLGGRLERVENFDINGEKRSLVVIKKVKITPEKYPRGRGLERKRPL